eukprot:58456-Pyramimonas_sp.AAC.1
MVARDRVARNQSATNNMVTNDPSRTRAINMQRALPQPNSSREDPRVTKPYPCSQIPDGEDDDKRDNAEEHKQDLGTDDDEEGNDEH